MKVWPYPSRTGYNARWLHVDAVTSSATLVETVYTDPFGYAQSRDDRSSGICHVPTARSQDGTSSGTVPVQSVRSLPDRAGEYLGHNLLDREEARLGSAGWPVLAPLLERRDPLSLWPLRWQGELPGERERSRLELYPVQARPRRAWPPLDKPPSVPAEASPPEQTALPALEQ